MRNSAAIQPAQPGTWAFVQVLAPIIEKRGWCLWIAGIGIAHLASSTFWNVGLGCPFRMIVGLPCPGCGLTHATLEILRGEWRNGFTSHAFAPLFLAALGLIAVSAAAPAELRSRLAGRVAYLEGKLGLGVLFGIALLGYWWARLH